MASTPIIQFGGVASGLNTSSIISALMDIEKQPLLQMQSRQAALQSEQTAYTTVQATLNDLLAKAQAFTVTGAGSGRSATSSDPSILTATASNDAVAGQYQVSVDHLATATVARSVNALATPITDTIASDPTQPISGLNLPGQITAGTFSVVVDCTVTTINVDPMQDLQSVLQQIHDAVASKLSSGGTVTTSIVGNRVQIAVSDGGAVHRISFGAGGDTSNAAGILGLATLGTSSADPTLTGTSALGVVSTTNPLDQAFLSGLSSTPMTGTLTVNGVGIAYDTSSDSLSTLITRINGMQAGVVASLDRTNDRLVLTSTSTGTQAISITDSNGTGGLAQALGLAPGTTAAQTLGQAAQVTVNGQTVYSTSNAVTNAIAGVTLDLLAQSPSGTTETLAVGVDTDGITQSINDFVSSFNSLGDTLDKLTQVTPGTPGQAGSSGPLANDFQVASLFLGLRSLVTQPVSGLTGTLNSLASIGISTGAVGSPTGSTNRLTLDQGTLQQALNADPQRVAQLLDDATGAMQPLVTQLQALTDPSDGYYPSVQTSITSQLSDLSRQEADEQEREAGVQAALEAKYANMEALLAQLQTESQSVTASSAAMIGGGLSGSSSSSGPSSTSPSSTSGS